MSNTEKAKAFMDAHPGPATNRQKNKVAVEHPVVTVRNGKFSELYLPVVPGGGLPGILDQLGIGVHA